MDFLTSKSFIEKLEIRQTRHFQSKLLFNKFESYKVFFLFDKQIR